MSKKLILTIYFISAVLVSVIKLFSTNETEDISALKHDLEYRNLIDNKHLKSFLYKDNYPKIDQIHFADKEGFIWMSRNNFNSGEKEFFRFDGKDFENVTQNFIVPDSDTLMTIETDGNGNIFFLGMKGFAKWNGNGYDYRRFPNGEIFLNIYSNHKGSVYFLGNNGYGIYSETEFIYRKLFIYGPWVEMIPVELKIELVDSKNRIWISWYCLFSTKSNTERLHFKYIGYIQNDKFYTIYEQSFSNTPFLNLEIIDDCYDDIYIIDSSSLHRFENNSLSNLSDLFNINQVIDYCKDNTGRIWIIGEDSNEKIELLCFDEKFKRNKYHVHGFAKNDLRISYTSQMHFFKNQILISFSNESFVLFNPDTKKVTKKVGFKFSDQNNTKYLVSENNIYLWDNDSHDLQIYREGKSYIKHKLINLIINELFKLNDNVLLINTDKGIFRFVITNCENIMIPEKSSSSIVNKLSNSNKGIWIECENHQGLMLYNSRISLYNKKYNDDEYLAKFLFEDPTGAIWFQGSKDNIYYLNNNKILSIENKFPILKEQIFITFFSDKSNKLWISFYSSDQKSSVYIFENEELVKYQENIDGIIEYIKQKSDDSYIYFINKYDKKTENFSCRICLEHDNKLMTLKQYSYSYISDVKLVNVDGISFELTKPNEEDNSLIMHTETITYNQDENYLSKSSTISSALFNNKEMCNKFWFISNEGSLISFDDNIYTSYGFDDHIASGKITDADVDLKSNLWFSSTGGLTKYDCDKNLFFSYSEEEGIPSCGINDIEINNVGEIFIGTDEGLKRFIEPNYSADLLISFLKTDSNIWFPYEKIIIPYSQNSIEINFKAISEEFPELIQFSYFLDGYSKNWSHLTHSNSAHFDNLSSGSYEFSFKSYLKNGKVLDGSSLEFIILPPWYNSWWFYTILSMVIIVFLYLLYKIRIKVLKQTQEKLETEVKTRTHQLSEAYSDLEEKNIKLTDSIQYASLIQNSILPRNTELSQYIKDFFIIWKPRDIVGGDFYWFYPIPKSENYIISVIDCTGHGVPGAFMSMTANSILNNIVREKQIYEPDEILNLLHKEIRYTLRQQAKESQQDGMDISLCYINVKSQEIHFAGALQSLYFVRISNIQQGISNDEKIIERIRGDRFSIGGRQKEEERIFTKHIIEYNSLDSIYMTSDGLADQKVLIDGKGTRLKTKRVEEMILKYCDISMKEQHEKIEGELMKLQDEFEQRDDITVIGIKLT